MAQEEHILSSSHSGSGGGDSGGGGGEKSEKVKQKKVPQRGLGVAQLEKIGLEEQRKREALVAANVLANNAIGSVNDASPCLGVQCPSFRPNLVSLPPPPLQRQRNDYLGIAFRPQPNLQFESNAPLPSVPRRSYRFQRHSSPVVNASSGISHSSLLSSQMEPPSNQSIHSNSYTPPWPEEYKMVGMKRSYPFSLESWPLHSFDPHPTSTTSKSRSDELAASCSSGYTDQMEPRNKYIIRDGPSNPREIISKDEYDGRLNGDFLTLAPPTAAKQKQPLDYDFKCLENVRSQIRQSGPSGSTEEPFSFFLVSSEIDPTTTAHVAKEKGETIDLNLKL